ncbi:unnamed protein product, partial [Allacma fusca]
MQIIIVIFVTNSHIQDGHPFEEPANEIANEKPRQSNRVKRRKLFFDEESDIMDVKDILKKHDFVILIIHLQICEGSLPKVLYDPTLSGKERSEMKNAFYSPSTTIVDSNIGKKKSLSPTGYIQSYFKNLWSSIREHSDDLHGASNPDALLEDIFEISTQSEKVEEMQRWLANHNAPPQK